MGLELALLIVTAACSGLSVLGVGWLAWRLRTRGIAATSAIVTTSSAAAFVGPHVHEFNERIPSKYDDARWHCGECGEPKPED